MAKGLAAILMLLMAGACAGVEQVGIAKPEVDPRALHADESEDILTPGAIFSRPLGVSLGMNFRRTECLPDSVDFLRKTEDELNRRGIEVTASELGLVVSVSTFNPRTALNPEGLKDRCLVLIETVLKTYGDIRISWAADKAVPAETVFYQHSGIYVSPPEQVSRVVQHEINQRLDEIAPTVLGRATRPCGYFKKDPDRYCEAHYGAYLYLSGYNASLGCMQSESEIRAFRKRFAEVYPDLMEWLAVNPQTKEIPHPEALPAEEPDCAEVRRIWLESRGGN